MVLAMGLLVVLRPDGEDDDGCGGDERPDEEGCFADARGAFRGLVGLALRGSMGVLVAGEERVVFGSLVRVSTCVRER